MVLQLYVAVAKLTQAVIALAEYGIMTIKQEWGNEKPITKDEALKSLALFFYKFKKLKHYFEN